ncbi:MAG: PAS domain S-box protein [Anaerolineales bacterium]
MSLHKEQSAHAKGAVSILSVNPPILGEIAFEAMMIFDSQRRITYWNRAAERLYGWTSKEALGKTAEELFWFTGTPQEEFKQKDLQTKIDRGKPCAANIVRATKTVHSFLLNLSVRLFSIRMETFQGMQQLIAR